MHRKFARPDVSEQWCQSHETHKAIAMAIHAIANSRRTSEQIWEAPTIEEFYDIADAVAEYVRHGDFDPSERFAWGNETLELKKD